MDETNKVQIENKAGVDYTPCKVSFKVDDIEHVRRILDDVFERIDCGSSELRWAIDLFADHTKLPAEMSFVWTCDKCGNHINREGTAISRIPCHECNDGFYEFNIEINIIKKGE